jgi:hypothetical protein
MPQTFFGDADLNAVMADALAIGAAVPVVIGSNDPIPGFLDEEGRNVLLSGGIGGASGTEIVISVQTNALPASLPNRTALTVDGRAMRLRDSQPHDDGALTRLICETTT